ncbi:MAG: cytochrome c biogenesis protein CcsA [Bdellovibrionota bacterium]
MGRITKDFDLLLLAIFCVLLAIGRIFLGTPEEASQGLVQKIFYIHVPSAITMYVGYFVGLVASIFYLVEKKSSWDRLAHCAIEVAYVFTVIVLCTGPLWAKPIWGTYWTWEPRLTSTLLLWFMYSAYLLIRKASKGEASGTKASAIVAIIAFANVPLVHLSVRLWRGIHPSVLANDNGLPDSMKATLLISFSAMLVLFAALLRLRLRVEKMSHTLQLQSMHSRGDQ